jgi:hypothetical protein
MKGTLKIRQLFKRPGLTLKVRIRKDMKSWIRIRTNSFRLHKIVNKNKIGELFPKKPV